MGKQSEAIFLRAQDVIAGGVSTPDQAFTEVGGIPRFLEVGQGSRIFDADNLQYIDCVGSWGSMILGHGHRYVVEAVKKAATRAFSFGAPTVAEVELAEMIVAVFPSMDMLHFVNSGTEATMSAVRLARATTGRSRIVQFQGSAHGHADAFLANDGGTPSSGVPAPVASLTTTVPFNDLDAARSVIDDEVAAVIVEPVAGNMGCVPPADGFLPGLRDACDDQGALLIFDEVITGFRVAYGGAQIRYDIRPDITVLGKIIGGGLPIGAYGGSRMLMENVTPLGSVYQGGTFSANPVAMAAGKSTLSVLKNSSIYDDLEERTAEFETGVRKSADKHGVHITFNRVGSMWTIFFGDQPVRDAAGAAKANREKYARFFHLMLAEGVYLPPTPIGCAFFSAAHAKKDILQLIDRVDRVMKKIAWEFEK